MSVAARRPMSVSKGVDDPLLGRADREIYQLEHTQHWQSTRRSPRVAIVCPAVLAVAAAGLWFGTRKHAEPLPPLHPHLPDFSVPSFVYHPKYACGICTDVISTQVSLRDGENACALFGACDQVNASVRSCVDYCKAEEAAKGMPQATDVPPSLNLRVAKGLGSKPYDLLRVSVVTSVGEDGPLLDGQPFDYSAPFRYRWTDNVLHSSLIHVEPGRRTELDVGGMAVSVMLPRRGDGVSGVLIADPCVAYQSVTTLVACTFGVKFELARRLPQLLDAFVGSNASDVSWWGILGDNLYDRTGGVTRTFFNALSVETKSKVLLTVLGNHDYWVLGTPKVATRWDQFGNGFVQWYAQDTVAADEVMPGDGDEPFDFSVDPDEGRANWMPFGGHTTAVENTFWYNHVGNVGFIGFSGAYGYDVTLPHIQRACVALQQAQPDVRIALLVGHWDVDNLGCKLRMDVPTFYDYVSQLPGCSDFAQKGMLKFFMGHTHCNVPHPHGCINSGFMVAGQGMEGCGNFGIPVVDTTSDALRVWYFPIVIDPNEPPRVIEHRFTQVLSCVSGRGWRECTHLATMWLNQTLPALTRS